MIDEDVLTDLLRRAAAEHDVPAGGPERVMEAAGPSATRPRARTRRQTSPRGRALLAVAAAVVLLAVAAGVGLSQRDDSNPAVDAVAQDLFEPEASTTTAPATAQYDTDDGAEEEAGLDAGIATGSTGAATGGGGAAGAGSAGAVATNVVTVPERIVRTGSIEVEVPRGRFDEAVGRLSSLATGAGGFVAGTETYEQGDAPSGSITIRIPGDSFEQVLGEVRRIGEVRSVTTNAQDVTGQHTDLEARLRALRATRDQLLTLLGRAEIIPDILAVQDRLNVTQMEIESLEGQLLVLNDQVTYGTLAVSLAEPGADEPVIEEEPEPSGLSKAWDDAVDNFSGGVEAIVAGSGTVLIVALFLGVLAGLARLAWVLGRRRLI